MARASEKPTKIEDLPAPVRRAVTLQSRGATILELSRDSEHGTTVYEVELDIKGHTKDISIAPDGKIVAVKEEVLLESIPAAARAAIEKAAGNGKIVRVETVTRGDPSSYYLEGYEAQLLKGHKKCEVEVNSRGKLLSKRE